MIHLCLTKFSKHALKHRYFTISSQNLHSKTKSEPTSECFPECLAWIGISKGSSIILWASSKLFLSNFRKCFKLHFFQRRFWCAFGRPRTTFFRKVTMIKFFSFRSRGKFIHRWYNIIAFLHGNLMNIFYYTKTQLIGGKRRKTGFFHLAQNEKSRTGPFPKSLLNWHFGAW